MSYELNQPRSVADLEDGEFPFDSNRVCYFEIVDGEPRQVPQYIGDRRRCIKRARAGEAKVFAVWPGEWRSDLFVLDIAEPEATR